MIKVTKNRSIAKLSKLAIQKEVKVNGYNWPFSGRLTTVIRTYVLP